jgi:catalase
VWKKTDFVPSSLQNQKVAALAADTKDVHEKSHRITSDYGVKQSNTDHWLSVSSEDKSGPMLLEDAFAREKVHIPDHMPFC